MIVDFNYYEDTYKGNKIPQDEDFKRIEVQASNKVKMYIMNRDYTNWCGKDYTEQVKLATCSVADILYETEQIQNIIDSVIKGGQDKIITSEKVADYSKSYGTATFKELQEEVSRTIVNKKIQDEINEYLWYTGLMNRGVGVVR